MYIDDIPHEKWGAFLKSFSDAYKGARAWVHSVDVKVLVQSHARNLPLSSVRAGPAPLDGRPESIEIVLSAPPDAAGGEGPPPVGVLQTIRRPVGMRVVRSDDGRSVMLEVKSADGSVMVLRVGPHPEGLSPVPFGDERAGGAAASHDERLREKVLAAAYRAVWLAPEARRGEAATDDSAAIIESHLDTLIEIVRTTRGDSVGPYLEAIAERVCRTCPYQHSDGYCPQRARGPCSLYRTADRVIPAMGHALRELGEEPQGAFAAGTARPEPCC